MAGLKLPALIFLATMLGSIPVMAVVTHKRDRQEQPIYAAAYPTNHSLILYDVDGNRVAFCDRDEHTAKLTNCQAEPGTSLDDVMNAWLNAYEDR